MATTSYKLKHPLIQAFGLALKKARKERRMSSDDMADAIGLGKPLYRLIEAGTAVLQPNRALDLIKALPDSHIQFRPLATLLVTFQVIGESQRGPALAGKKQAIAFMRRQADELVEDFVTVDKGLAGLFRALAPIWSVFDETTQQDLSRRIVEAIEDQNIPGAIMNFLAVDKEPEEEEAAVISEAAIWARYLIEGTPPLYFDMTLSMLDELKGFSPQMDPHNLARWERNRWGKFRNVYAVLEDLSILLDTYTDFDWRLVSYRNFKSLHIISLSEGPNLEEEGRRFKELYKFIKREEWFRGRANNHVAEKNLMQLHFIPQEDAAYRDKFRSLMAVGKTGYKHAWVYELMPTDEIQFFPSYPIAIMDNRVPDSPEKEGATRDGSGGIDFNSIHCSWRHTQDWLSTIRKFLRIEGGEQDARD